MKKLIYLFLIISILSCNSESSNDCFQTSGETVQQEFEVQPFSKIVVHKHIALVLTEGPTQKVVVQTGKNLLNDIDIQVIDNEIILVNKNQCNFFRSYANTTVYITSPNITSIRNASEFNVSSNGVLTYPNLYLRSSGEKSNFLAVGDWHLNIQNSSVRIWSNGVATFFIQGSTDNLDINFSDGDTRFEGKDFLVKNIKLKQVSSNDMLIFPVESLTGSIHSTGNVLSYNKPPIVDVDVQNVGSLLFK